MEGCLPFSEGWLEKSIREGSTGAQSAGGEALGTEARRQREELYARPCGRSVSGRPLKTEQGGAE